MDKVTPVFLHRGLPAAAALLPQAVERIKAFCHKYDTDTKADEIEEHVWRLFGTADQRLGLWVFVDSNYKLLGHLLAQPEPFDLPANMWSYCLIRQAEIDKGQNLMAEASTVMRAVEEWTKFLGMKRILILTHRSEEAMARRWGFRLHKRLMEKVLD